MSKCCECNSFCSPLICCEKCKLVWFCDSLCGSTFRARDHVEKCNGNPNSLPATVRFQSGYPVLVCTSLDTWKEGVVVERSPNSNHIYQIRILESNDIFNVKRDTNAEIQLISGDIKSAEGMLFHYVRCGTSISLVKESIRLLNYSTTYPWDKLFSLAVGHGNYDVILLLVSELGYNSFAVDEKGRNMLQLAIMNKMTKIFHKFDSTFGKFIDRRGLYFQNDNEGRNSLHYAIIFDKGVHLDENFITQLKTIPNGNELYGKRDVKGFTPLDYAGMMRQEYSFSVLLTPTITEMIRLFDIAVGNQQKFHDEVFYLEQLKLHFTVKGLTIDNCFLTPQQIKQMGLFALHCAAYGFVDCLRWLYQESGWELYQQAFVKGVSVLRTCVIFMENGSAHEQFIEMYHYNCDTKKYNKEYNKVSSSKKRQMYSLFGDLCVAHCQTDYTSDGLVALLDRLADHSKPITMNNVIAPVRPTYDLSELQSQLLTPLSTDTVYWFQMYLFELHHKLSGAFLLEKRIEVVKYSHYSFDAHDPFVLMTSFATGGQVRLLQWYVCENNIDLRTSLKETYGEKMFDFNATYAHYWCLIAATKGYVHVLEYLFPYLDNNCEYRTTFSPGYNMVEASILSGNFLVFDWLMKRSSYDVEKLPGLFYSLVVPNYCSKNHHVAWRIVAKLGNKALFPLEDGLIQWYYSSNSGSVLFDSLWFKAARAIQTCIRRHLQWRQYRHYFGHNLPLYMQFKRQWSGVVSALEACAAQKTRLGAQKSFSWLALKKQFDLVATRLSDDEDRGDENIVALTTAAMQLNKDREVDVEITHCSGKAHVPDSESSCIESDGTTGLPSCDVAEKPLHSIELSQHVLKWLHSADSRYRAMFHKKVTLLADGYRSYV